MWEDPIVAEIHRTRKNLARQYNNDMAAYFADLRKRQAESGTNLVRQQEPAVPASLPTAITTSSQHVHH
jgi:hypothetical protein